MPIDDTSSFGKARSQMLGLRVLASIWTVAVHVDAAVRLQGVPQPLHARLQRTAQLFGKFDLLAVGSRW